MVGREAVALRMIRDVGIRYERFSRMIRPEQPVTARQLTDRRALLIGDPAGDELA